MANALNTGALHPPFGAAPLAHTQPEGPGLSGISNAAAESVKNVGHRLYRDVTEKQPGVRQRDYLLLGGVVIALHIAGVEVYIHMDKAPALQAPKKNEVVVELVKPQIIPPPKIEPPKPVPPPPQPKVSRPPPPAPTPALRTPPAEHNIAADDMTVKENTQGARSTEPVVAEAPAPVAPPAPPPPKEEPVTEATGYAGYLNNPAPPYPAVAERQGWEGKVLLRVRVLANGTVSAVEVKQSSGRKALDDAAATAVKGWKFSPSKRGSTPIDGWANVPIEFRLAQ